MDLLIYILCCLSMVLYPLSFKFALFNLQLLIILLLLIHLYYFSLHLQLSLQTFNLFFEDNLSLISFIFALLSDNLLCLLDFFLRIGLYFVAQVIYLCNVVLSFLHKSSFISKLELLLLLLVLLFQFVF